MVHCTGRSVKGSPPPYKPGDDRREGRDDCRRGRHGRPGLSSAGRRIGKRDPDDVDVLALALTLNLPVWSNDNDFENAGVEWYTTAELLKTLGIESA